MMCSGPQRQPFNIVNYLSHSTPKSSKHASNKSMHPFVASVVHHVLSTTVILILHDKLLFSSLIAQRQARQLHSIELHYDATRSNDQTAYALAAYYAIVFFLRHRNAMTKNVVLYETMWLCNTTLLVGSYCFKTRRETMAFGYLIAVSIDQVLWYVDLSVWIGSGRKTFPIGVAKYLTWPSTPWYTRFTCTHHLWTIPVFLRAYLHSSHHDRQMMSGNVMLRCFTLSCVIVTTHVVLSRWLTPFSIEIIGNGKDSDGDTQADRHHYLNINLSHELWKDITFSFLQISKDAPSPCVYIFRLLWRWWLFNGLVFYGLLLPIFNWFSSIIMK